MATKRKYSQKTTITSTALTNDSAKRTKHDDYSSVDAEVHAEARTLLDLPGEIRNIIYGYVLDGDYLVLKHHNTGSRPRKKPGNANLIHTCRVLRHDFLSFRLNRLDVYVRLLDMPEYAASFDRKFKGCKLSLKIFYEGTQCSFFGAGEPVHVDLMPLLRLAHDMPRFEVDFSPMMVDPWREPIFPNGMSHKKVESHGMDEVDDDVAEDMIQFVRLSHKNKLWAQELEKIEAVTFYTYRRFMSYMRRQSEYLPCLQLDYKKEHKAAWMSGTHNFDDLQAYLAQTGLAMLQLVDVRVGLTSMENRKFGKGFRSFEVQEKLDWLRGRSTKKPCDGAFSR